MILLLSPSKTLDYSEPEHGQYSQPRMLEKSTFLIENLRKKPEAELKKLMKISDELAAVNAERYQDFEVPFSLSNAKQALLAFKGDVYLGLEAESFSEADLAFAQSHIRILSGLYYRVIAFFAKKARGAMASYAVRNRIEDPQGLKGFNWEGYMFNEALSSDYEFSFTR